MSTRDGDGELAAEMLRALLPCRAGCVVRGTEESDDPTPMTRAHGQYCARCYSRLSFPLRIAADLAEHLAGLLDSHGTGGDEAMVKASKASAPLPMNEAIFNDVNEMYETLIYLARYFARVLRVSAPTPATHAWRNEAGHVKGLPANVTPAAARYQTAAIATWLDSHLNAILAVIDPDDLEGFTGRAALIGGMARRHQMRMQPRYSAMPHECGGRIVIHPPRHLKDDEYFICEKCGLVLSEWHYLILLREWRETQLAEKRRQRRETAAAAKRTADHLAAKYAGDLMLTQAPTSVSDLRRRSEYERIREALATAALDIPPGGVLVTHDEGATRITITHDVEAGKVQHAYPTANGHIIAPPTRIGEYS